MHPVISNAEYAIRIELQTRGIRDLKYQWPIILDQTTVDIAWENETTGEHQFFFIDGPPHLEGKVIDRDDHINFILDKWNHTHYHRLPYTPPLSRKRLNEICDFIMQNTKHWHPPRKA